MQRWGALAEAAGRLSLGDILEDMERLGFITSVERRSDSYRFRRSARWMGDAAGQT